MKVDFSQAMVSFDGTALQEPTASGGELKNITLALVTVNAVLAPTPNRQESGDEKAKAYCLAQKVHAGGHVDLTLDEVGFIKSKIGEHMPAIVVGQAFAMLEAAADKLTLRSV